MHSPVKLWRNQSQIARLLGKTGTVISWTIIRVPPGGFSDQAPYPVVLVEFDNGKRIEAQLVGAPIERGKHDFTGMKVRTMVRRITHPDADGVIPYGIKVVPLD